MKTQQYPGNTGPMSGTLATHIPLESCAFKQRGEAVHASASKELSISKRRERGIRKKENQPDGTMEKHTRRTWRQKGGPHFLEGGKKICKRLQRLDNMVPMGGIPSQWGSE